MYKSLLSLFIAFTALVQINAQSVSPPYNVEAYFEIIPDSTDLAVDEDDIDDIDIELEEEFDYSEGEVKVNLSITLQDTCLLYTSPSPRDATLSRMPSSA